MLKLPTRLRLVSPTTTLVASLALAILTTPILTIAGAQAPAIANSYVYQYQDDPNTYLNTTANGCATSASGTGPVSAFAYCFVPPIPGGSGSLLGRGVSAFDPAAGTFKSLSALNASNFTLAQFIPTYDALGNRIYTGAPRPDAVGVYTYVGLTDVYSLNASAGSLPATMSLFLDVDGSLNADPQLNGASGYASSFINFCTAAAGICGSPTAATDAFYGGSYLSGDSKGNYGFLQQSFAPAGANPASVTFAGTHYANYINGRLTLADIPVSSGTPFDFNFFFGSQVGIFHPTASLGNIPVGCDPALDPSCTAVGPVDIDGATYVDFYNTLTFAGYQILDANGNDITNSVQLNFGSGLNVPPTVTATPEPGTFALVSGGMLLLGVGVRRKSRRD